MKKKTTKIGSQTTSGRTKQGSRPPVVVFLGHIDHGKTTLLSKIKEIDLTRKEHGGITQHLSVYQVAFKAKDGKIKEITFIDTPGHAAFNNLRARGAKIADLAVLVVAASEGVKPQTKESLKFIQQAKIPFLVALNKIDLSEVIMEKAKKNLADNDIKIEGYGGDIVVVPVSAKEGKGITDLLEMILLLAEMNNIKGNPQAELEAVVLESKMDARRGPLATLLVRNGSLKVNDEIKVEEADGKIKAMFNDKGEKVEEALPSQAVEVLGFHQVPTVGGKVEIVKEKITEKKIPFKKEIPTVSPETKKSEQKPEEAIEKIEEKEEKKLKIVLKVDVEGSLEAIKANLPEDCQLIKAEVGEINDSDVLLAATNHAEIFAFNVKISKAIKKLAEAEEIKINSYQVIYEFLDDLEKKILRFLSPDIDEQVLGKAEILAEFKMKERVAGCVVLEGEIKKEDQIHLFRGENLLGNGRFKSLKQGKKDVEQIKRGEEFGAVLSSNLDFQIGDVIVSYLKPQS
jgi:translation initiation factor IF-2